MSGALANREEGPREHAKAVIRSHAADFAEILPRTIRPEGWVRVTAGVIQRNDKLVQATIEAPDSIVVALLNAARLGLEPGTEQYYLVPRKNKGRQEAQGIVGYIGHVQLMYRGGLVGAVHADTVHAADKFVYRKGIEAMPIHEAPGGNWFATEKERGRPLGAYAFAQMTTGQVSEVIRMTAEEIAAHRDRNPFSKDPESPWVRWPKSMWKKTPTRELQKWVPTSAEHADRLREALAKAQEKAEGAGIDPDEVGDLEHPDVVPGDVGPHEFESDGATDHCQHPGCNAGPFDDIHG